MVATNRLTGHSKGFFSVYTLPPNQAVSPERQIKINRRLRQKPEYRDVAAIILAKSRSLLRNVSERELELLRSAGRTGRFLTGDARTTPAIRSASVQLTVTSPPFLDVVDYASDNWLRCWFNGLNAATTEQSVTRSKTLDGWTAVMTEVFRELYRITRRGGWVAFEVGEIRNGTVSLEERVIPAGSESGFHCEALLINSQRFSKTSNIWGIRNNEAGTNTNRIVLFRRP
jgi:hypothetical protein